MGRNRAATGRGSLASFLQRRHWHPTALRLRALRSYRGLSIR